MYVVQSTLLNFSDLKGVEKMARKTQKDKRREFLEAAFEYLVDNGLENTSIRDLCAGTGISSGSVYYWFDSKEKLFVEATEYGTERVLEKIFELASDNLADLKSFFDNCLKLMDEYKKHLRFIFQFATSNVYGERFRQNGDSLAVVYERYSKQLAMYFKCSEDEVRPLIYLFSATISNYVIWDDVEKTKVRFEYLFKLINTHASREGIKI